jgi:hypothetical protein
MSDFAEMLRRAAQANTTSSIDPDAVFTEEPVPLSVFVQDAAFLHNPPLSPVQYDAVRHIERIYLPELYPVMADEFEVGRKPGRLCIGPVSAWREERYWAEPIRMINFATLQWGKGGGKDHVCRIVSMRIAYLVMCLRSPQEYFGIPAQDTIHLLNVASSSQQAQQAFFLPITRAVKRGWFAHKCDPKQNVISFEKNIEAISGHSDAETQEGMNLLLGIADEVDAFKSQKEMAVRRGGSAREPTKSAEGILKMLRSSGITRFPRTFKNVRISYPRYKGSTIQKLTAEARDDIKALGQRSRHYVSGPLATWEVRPVPGGREAFADEYREDPVMARAKYECKPARAINPYFRNRQAVESCFAPTQRLPVTVDYDVEDGEGGRQVWVPRYRFGPQLVPIRGAVYAMHADMAVTADRAGIAMAHVARFSEHEVVSVDEDGAPTTIREVRPHVKVDFVISYSADTGATPPREIQIRWARQLCFELIRQGFNIRLLTFDGFQSLDSMQILEAKGIETEKVSTDSSEDPWRTLRDLMYEERVTIPRLAGEDGADIPCRLVDELLGLTKLPNGKVDHPADGSKDEADALACAVMGAIGLGGEEEDPDARAYHATADFETGTLFDLPLGTPAMDKLWTPALPGW